MIRLPRFARLMAFGGLVALATALAIFDGLIVATHASAHDWHDFGKFLHSARQFLDGRPMYSGSATLEVGRWLNLNPPHFHFLLLPLTRFPVGVAFSLWCAGLGAATLVAAAVIVAETGVHPTSEGWVATIAVTLAWPGVVAALWSGGVGYLLLLPLTLSWREARHGKWGRAGAWLGLAMSWKLFLAVFLPYLAWRDRRGLLAAIVSALAVTAAGVAVFGVDAYRGWMTMLGEVNWQDWVFNASLQGILTRALAEPGSPIAFAPRLVLPLWMVGGLSVWAAAVRRALRAGTDVAFAVLTLTAVLVSPLGWTHYLVIAAGPAVALWRDRTTWLPSPALAWPLATAAVIGLLWPRPWLPPGASVYFWSLLAAWMLVMLPAKRPMATAPDVALVGGGGGTHA